MQILEVEVITSSVYFAKIIRKVLNSEKTTPAKVGIKSCRCALFVHIIGCMCMFELTVTGWWIIVT